MRRNHAINLRQRCDLGGGPGTNYQLATCVALPVEYCQAAVISSVAKLGALSEEGQEKYRTSILELFILDSFELMKS